MIPRGACNCHGCRERDREAFERIAAANAELDAELDQAFVQNPEPNRVLAHVRAEPYDWGQTGEFDGA